MKYNKSKHALISKYSTTQNEHKKPHLFASYDLKPGNKMGLFSKK